MNGSFFQSDTEIVNRFTNDLRDWHLPATGGGFCGARIHPECLRIDSCGAVRVCLSATPQEWFEMLSRLGETLHLARNPIVVMGELGCSQTFPQGAKNGQPRFMPNLPEYGSLWAIRENSPAGALYGFEVRDVSGTGFEHITLTAAADHDLFAEFVMRHQSPPERAGSWFPPNDATSARRRAKLAERIPRLRQQWSSGDRIIRRLRPRCVSRLLAAAMQHQLQVRTTYYYPALVRAMDWTPICVTQKKTEAGRWEFFHGAKAGLHLNGRAIASVWLWTGACSCCNEQRWHIEAGDTHDHIGLTIAAGGETSEMEWRKLVKCHWS